MTVNKRIVLGSQIPLAVFDFPSYPGELVKLTEVQREIQSDIIFIHADGCDG